MPGCSRAELGIHCVELSQSPNALCLSLHIFRIGKLIFFSLEQALTKGNEHTQQLFIFRKQKLKSLSNLTLVLLATEPTDGYCKTCLKWINLACFLYRKVGGKNTSRVQNVAKRRADGEDEIKKVETEREQKGGMGRGGPEIRGRNICDEVGRCFKRDSYLTWIFLKLPFKFFHLDCGY